MDIPVIIIPGMWNHAIFSQDWVSRYLLPNETLVVEYPLTQNCSIRFSTNELRIYTVESRLLINILIASQSVFEKIENLVVKLAEYLPHTPITALGYNFVFNYDSTELMETTTFLLEKHQLNGYTVASVGVKSSYKKDDMQVNIESNTSSNELALNFHFEVFELSKYMEIISLHPINSLFETAQKISEELLKK